MVPLAYPVVSLSLQPAVRPVPQEVETTASLSRKVLQAAVAVGVTRTPMPRVRLAADLEVMEATEGQIATPHLKVQQAL